MVRKNKVDGLQFTVYSCLRQLTVNRKPVIMNKDYYHILEVDKNATADEIKKSFHRLAFLHHPDRNGNAISEDQFKEINEAYQCLSDSMKRENYDTGKAWFQFYTVMPEPYLHAEISDQIIKLNEEFEITYRYIGEGRFFRKPQSKDFVFTSGPVVDHRNFLVDNNPVRETILTYTVSAMSTGTICFEPATIEVRHQHISSEKLSIEVKTNECYFKQGMMAGSEPLKLQLHKEQFSSTSIYRKKYTYRHVLFIPRSEYAAYYHRIGSIMKGVFAACGMLLFMLNRQHALIGFVCGSLIGGALCQLMYRMSGVRSKYFYAYKHPDVNAYLEKGYEIGNDPINIFVSDNVIQRLVMLFK